MMNVQASPSPGWPYLVGHPALARAKLRPAAAKRDPVRDIILGHNNLGRKRRQPVLPMRFERLPGPKQKKAGEEPSSSSSSKAEVPKQKKADEEPSTTVAAGRPAGSGRQCHYQKIYEAGFRSWAAVERSKCFSDMVRLHRLNGGGFRKYLGSKPK
jgi:hypothetical protein